MKRILPGEIWRVDFGLAAKVRPALVLSDYPRDDELALLIVVPHTSSMPCRRVFIRSIFPCRTGLSGSGGTGAEAQWLFMPEPSTRKTRLTRAGQQARENGRK
jgi:hypothetical protein